MTRHELYLDHTAAKQPKAADMITYLKTFFEEKTLPYVQWELPDNDGVTHIIDNDVVIEHIAIAPTAEQNSIADVIRKIDFYDGDVNHFLQHLAGAIINK